MDDEQSSAMSAVNFDTLGTEETEWELEPGYVLLRNLARSPGALAFTATIVAIGMTTPQSYQPGEHVLVLARPESIWAYSDRMLVTFTDHIVGSERREPKPEPKLIDLPTTQTGTDQS